MSTALFGIVAIVQGGGSQVELNCYDCYELAAAIANLPLPVLTSIGHESDEYLTYNVSP